MEKFIELGKTFGLEGAELLSFVEKSREEEREDKRREEEREERRRKEEEKEEKLRREEEEKEERLRRAEEEKEERRRRQDEEREARRQERDIRKLQMEAELQRQKAEVEEAQRRHELEMKRLELEQTPAGPAAQVSNKEDRAKAPKLPSFVDGKDDLDAYLHRFERFATTAKWEKAGWATKLSALLSGRALDVYSRLSEEAASDYDKMKIALMKRYDLTEDGYRRKFRVSTPEIDESPDQFIVRLSTYLIRWLELSKTEKTFEGLKDLIVKEQFINSCPKELAVHLREQAPETLEEIAKIADQYLEAHGKHVFSPARSKPPTPPEKDDNRMPASDTTPLHCFRCNGRGHRSANCPNELVRLQREDKSLEKYWDRRDIKVKGEQEVSFEEKDGVLYRSYKHPHVNGGKPIRQVMVPTPLRRQLMEVAHESIMGGHMGVKKTADKIQKAFYWPGIQGDVSRHCKSCDICQKTVNKGSVPKVPLQKMPLIDMPFKRVAIDLIGPIKPPSEEGHRYILTLVDYATRYPEAVPLKNIDTETVAEALVDIFSRLGIPEEILSDLGTQFVSDCMKEVARLLSIKQLTTTPYHPMCNGMTEKFNGTLKTTLKRLCSEQPRQWHRYINPLLFAYREVAQESTGFSPFELLYGRAVRGPMYILKELWTKEVKAPEVKNSYQYVFELREKLEDTLKNYRKPSKKENTITTARPK